MLFVSLGLSINVAADRSPSGYFLPQYRGFELLIGAGLALSMSRNSAKNTPEIIKQAANYLGVIAILIPIFTLDNDSSFPGLNALWPCLGTALIIGFPNKGLVTRALSAKWMVTIGLISYPLYLYHQPLISFFHYFNLTWSPWALFFFVCILSFPAAWITYRYLEKPLRQAVHKKNRASSLITTSLSLTIPLFAIVGIVIAKTNGLEMRFAHLNPFSVQVIKAHAFSFHEKFQRGINIDSKGEKRILFIGDSALQQYVDPIASALQIPSDKVDSVTRGGCVLLKGVEFIDSYSDISCNRMREDLYRRNDHYNYIVISQLWSSYDQAVRNFPKKVEENARWAPFINASITHFSPLAGRIIIIGRHLDVEGTGPLQPTLRLNEEDYISGLDDLHIINAEYLQNKNDYFSTLEKENDVTVIEPYRIFCSTNEHCVLRSEEWSFFSDRHHISSTSTQFVSERIKELLDL